MPIPCATLRSRPKVNRSKQNVSSGNDLLKNVFVGMLYNRLLFLFCPFLACFLFLVGYFLSHFLISFYFDFVFPFQIFRTSWILVAQTNTNTVTLIDVRYLYRVCGQGHKYALKFKPLLATLDDSTLLIQKICFGYDEKPVPSIITSRHRSYLVKSVK